MRRRPPFVSVLAALLALPLAAQQPTVWKVGTWNLEFLGAPGPLLRNETPPRSDDDYAAIGRKIADLGVAVLAVQEVNDKATLRKVAAAAGPTWHVLLGSTGTWDDGVTAQRIGFVWNAAAVELLHAEELLQLPRRFEGAPIFHRVPVTACFRHEASGCDFRLVTVHCKAGREQADEHKRRAEATQLAQWLDALAADAHEDRDVLLLGDFNASSGSEPERLLERSGARTWLEPRTKGPTVLHFAEPTDHAVGATGFAELQRDSLVVERDRGGLSREAWRKVYSDHYPVVVTLAARGDDDPEATFARGPAAQALSTTARLAAPVAGATPEGRTRGAVWPPPVGAVVWVTTADAKRLEGRLLQDVPSGPGGWLVFEQDNGQVIALPWSQIALLRVR